MQPYELVAGKELPKVRTKKIDFDDRAGGLFTASGGPKPPPALPLSVVGMKVGGKVGSAAPVTVAAASETNGWAPHLLHCPFMPILMVDSHMIRML